jgi:PAS domain S-box-containing protein
LVSGSVVVKSWGYSYSIPSNPLFFVLGTAWGIVLGFLSLLVCIRHYYHVREKSTKKQIRLVTIGFAVPIIVYSITNAGAPLFHVDSPPLGSVSIMVLSIFVGCAIWKYQLFALNPALAAENIISTMPDSLILADQQGIILHVNPSLVELTEFSAEELVGKPLNCLFVNQHEAENILRALANAKTIKGSETLLRTKSGETRTVEFSASSVRDRRRHNLGFTCHAHDITQLKNMQEKLVNAERLASIGELAGMVGHDLRNPLTGITNAAYYLRKRSASIMNDKEREMLKTIERCVERSNNIINELLEYSKEIRLDLVETNPKSLMEDALSQIVVPASVEIADQTQVQPMLKIDKEKMARVFINIIKNAFDAMPNGGRLIIKSEIAENNVVFSFKDTGTGMTKEVMSKIWTPLFTTKAAGMGFGLSICKRVVEAHGGKISAESTVGKGTTFTLIIPIEPTLEGDDKICRNEPEFLLSTTMKA